MSDPKCFLVVSRMKIFICILSSWFSTLQTILKKQGIEEKCCSRKCRLLGPFSFHYRANAITCKSRLQRFLNCAALMAVWRKTNDPMHPNFKDGCQTSKTRERYQKGIFEAPHSIKTSRCHLKTTAEFLKTFLLYFCLSSSYKDDPIFSISCPIIIYSIVHYHLICLQKGTALNCNSSISTSQHGRTTALLSLYITVQLQEHPAPINISHKYSYKYIPPATLWDNIQDHPSLTQNWVTSATWHSFVHHSTASCWPQEWMGHDQIGSTSQ